MMILKLRLEFGQSIRPPAIAAKSLTFQSPRGGLHISRKRRKPGCIVIRKYIAAQGRPQRIMVAGLQG